MCSAAAAMECGKVVVVRGGGGGGLVAMDCSCRGTPSFAETNLLSVLLYISECVYTQGLAVGGRKTFVLTDTNKTATRYKHIKTTKSPRVFSVPL